MTKTTTTSTTTTQSPLQSPHQWLTMLANHMATTTAKPPRTKIETPKRAKYDDYQVWRVIPSTQAHVDFLREYKMSSDGEKIHWLKGPAMRWIQNISFYLKWIAYSNYVVSMISYSEVQRMFSFRLIWTKRCKRHSTTNPFRTMWSFGIWNKRSNTRIQCWHDAKRRSWRSHKVTQWHGIDITTTKTSPCSSTICNESTRTLLISSILDGRSKVDRWLL